MACGDSLGKEIKDILKTHPNLVVGENNNRVKCILTGHEMPCTSKAIAQYLSGKKYKRLTKDLEKTFKYSDYEPQIVPSDKKGHEHHLFCTLTLRHINRTPSHILRHVKGKRYVKAKERWDQCQKDGTKFTPTPYLNKSKDRETGLEISDELGRERVDSDVDSLSDLYPIEHFGDLSLDEEVAGDNIASGSAESTKKRTAKSAGISQNKKSKAAKPPIKKKKKANLMVFA